MHKLIHAHKNGMLHHAYLVVGEVKSLREEIERFVTEHLHIPICGNPDVYMRKFDVFGIDNVREIQSLESKRASAGEKKIFVISVNAITREAQNALLKTLEEPTAGTHFFILTQSVETLLPTLVSRMHVITLPEKKERTAFAKQFLSSPAPSRLALIEDIIESKNKSDALELVNRLEDELHSRTNFRGREGVPTEAFEALQSVRSYLTDRSSSVKILLEYLSVALPRIS